MNQNHEGFALSTTHDKPQESTDPEPRQFEGVELTMGPKRWPSSIDIGRESLESEMKATGKQLRRHMFLYLWLNQAAYAIVALPIGIVLSIAPLFLNHQLGVSVPVIGLFMTGGELLGVLAMWAAERAKSGFILRRPHDIHLIIFSVASFVALIPVWPKAVWYFAATCMMAVQALNSASKPVVGRRGDPSYGYAYAQAAESGLRAGQHVAAGGQCHRRKHVPARLRCIAHIAFLHSVAYSRCACRDNAHPQLEDKPGE